jgi:hypothetical protein
MASGPFDGDRISFSGSPDEEFVDRGATADSAKWIDFSVFTRAAGKPAVSDGLERCGSTVWRSDGHIDLFRSLARKPSEMPTKSTSTTG